MLRLVNYNYYRLIEIFSESSTCILLLIKLRDL